MSLIQSLAKTSMIIALALLILAIICLVYGFCIAALRSGTLFHFVWIFLGALFLLSALIVYKGWWQAAPIFLRFSICIIFALVLVWFISLYVLILTQLDTYKEDAAATEPSLDYIIVLGAQVRPTGPSPILQFRLDTALYYLENNPSTICIVSGGKGNNEHEAEAQVMARYLIERGISDKRILIEDSSCNTYENITNSMHFFDSKVNSIGIVTNNFHVFRSVALAQKKGIVQVRGIGAPSLPFYLPNNILREMLGITKDLFSGNI